MKPTKLVAILAVFLCGCMGPIYTHNLKVEKMNSYARELEKRKDINYLERHALFWNIVEQEFPEERYHLNEIRVRLKAVSIDEKSGKSTNESWKEYKDYANAFWEGVRIDAELAERGNQNQNQYNGQVFQGMAGMFLQMQQQQQRSYDDLNRSIRESGPINCYTKQWHPDGIIHTTCD